MTQQFPLRVEILTEDPQLRDICERYWAMKGAQFRYSIKEIADTHKKTTKEVIKLALQYSRAFRYHCPKCSRPRTYSRGRSILTDNPGRELPQELCAECNTFSRNQNNTSGVQSVKPLSSTTSTVQQSQQSPTSAQDIRRIEELRRAEEAARKRNIVRKQFPIIQVEYLNPRTLDLEDVIALLSLLRTAGSEDFFIIEPVSHSHHSLYSFRKNDWGDACENVQKRSY